MGKIKNKKKKERRNGYEKNSINCYRTNFDVDSSGLSKWKESR